MQDSFPTPAGEFAAVLPQLSEVPEFVDPAAAQAEEIPPHPATVAITQCIERGLDVIPVGKVFGILYGDKKLTYTEKQAIFDVFNQDPRIMRIEKTTKYEIVDSTLPEPRIPQVEPPIPKPKRPETKKPPVVTEATGKKSRVTSSVGKLATKDKTGKAKRDPEAAERHNTLDLASIGGDRVVVAADDINDMLRNWRHSIAGNVNQRKPSSGRHVHYKKIGEMSSMDDDEDSDEYED